MEKLWAFMDINQLRMSTVAEGKFCFGRFDNEYTDNISEIEKKYNVKLEVLR